MNALFKGGEQSSEVIKRAKQNTGVKGEWRKKKSAKIPLHFCSRLGNFSFFFFFKSHDVVIDPSPNHTLNCSSSTNEYFNAYISC